MYLIVSIKLRLFDTSLAVTQVNLMLMDYLNNNQYFLKITHLFNQKHIIFEIVANQGEIYETIFVSRTFICLHHCDSCK